MFVLFNEISAFLLMIIQVKFKQERVNKVLLLSATKTVFYLS